MADRWTGSVVTAARAYWAARILEANDKGRPLLCPFCDNPVSLEVPWDVDHDDKRIDGGFLGRANQRPAHRACNRSDGARVGNTRRSRARRRIRR